MSENNLIVGNNVVYRGENGWVPGIIVDVTNIYIIKPETPKNDNQPDVKIQKDDVRLRVLIKCEEIWVSGSIVKKDENSDKNSYLVEFDEPCPVSTGKIRDVELSNIYVFEKAKNLQEGTEYLFKSDSKWISKIYQKNDGDSNFYIKKKWNSTETNPKSSFLENLLEKIDPANREEALELFKNLFSNKKIKTFKGSSFSINDKPFENTQDENILDVADMIITYLYSEIKISKKIRYYESGNHFRLISSKMDKIIKVTNDKFTTYPNKSDSDLNDSDSDLSDDLSDSDLDLSDSDLE